ncbi:TetR/AcrR family transcriptional regulator [Rathayibacter sp. YIM 133350]|uniref:TetR/AcrR family transcriptional regulator n=1 Tax=Rathayibacter sp. YIM 133350 TaxID=3131992 RepID=UPI00307FA570
MSIAIEWSDMPTPERTTLDRIVSAAREVLESEGLDAVTMSAVADRVGVRAPSLYKRVQSRDHLIGLVIESTLRQLAAALDAALEDADLVTASGGARQDARAGRAAIIALAGEFRAFALAAPAAFRLVFADLPAAARPSDASITATSAAIVRAATLVVGEQYALEAARTVTAWTYGFVSMELAGAFRLGGDVQRAYDYGVERLAAAIADGGVAPLG